MAKTKKAKVELMAVLETLWETHDAMERAILLTERHFSDKELREMGAAAAKK